LTTYWQQTINALESENHDYKIHQLPLARIKKVMKADPDVKMISAEAPILFAKGCDIFITELTMRAWIHAEDNKRRTLQRSDIAAALAKSDMFDFLIDIVPREEAASHAKRTGTATQAAGAATQPSSTTAMPQANVQQAQHPSTAAHHGLGPDYGPMPSGYDEYRAAQFASHHDPAQFQNAPMGGYDQAFGYGMSSNVSQSIILLPWVSACLLIFNLALADVCRSGWSWS
jgi:nuclear transcription factor Y, gamma